MKFENLAKRVLQWADEKGILAKGNPVAQAAKMMEEAQETQNAVLDEDMPEIIDGIGDTFVTLIILAEMLNLDPVHCLWDAYDIIIERKANS